MLHKLKGFSSAFFGFAILCGFFVIGAILLVGTAKVSAFIYPLFSALNGIGLATFFFIVLPLSLMNKARPFLAKLTIFLSYICAATLWMYSFLTIFYILGWWALLLFIWFQAIAPIAVIGLLFQGKWSEGMSIMVMVALVYGMRFYAVWLAMLCERRVNDEEFPEVIDARDFE